MVLAHAGHLTYIATNPWHRFAVRDLATRFADGRLSNQKLLDANDEELFDLLTAVYGIGKVSQAFTSSFRLIGRSSLPPVDR
jgi:DNA-3-methyladenine glycosylase II